LPDLIELAVIEELANYDFYARMMPEIMRAAQSRTHQMGLFALQSFIPILSKKAVVPLHNCESSLAVGSESRVLRLSAITQL
jgi:hypothetical protein